MAEIADMMFDGTLCQVCGEYIGGTGHPTTCAACRPSRSNKKTKAERWHEVAMRCPKRDLQKCYSSKGKALCGQCSDRPKD